MTTDQPGPHIPDAPPHGTLRGWSLGCRCLFCKSAKTATTPLSEETYSRRSEGSNASTSGLLPTLAVPMDDDASHGAQAQPTAEDPAA